MGSIPFIRVLILAVLATAPDPLWAADARPQHVLAILGMECPLDVALNPPQKNGGGVTGGFLWDPRGRMLKWACDGGLVLLPPGGTSNQVIRYLYLGARDSQNPSAEQLDIGSEKEAALREALRLYCERVLPESRSDSLRTALDEARPENRGGIILSMSECQRDAIRLWPVLRAFEAQAARHRTEP